MTRHPFTLLELLVAAFSLAVLLAALAMPVQGALRERERANEAAAETFRLRRAMDRVLDDLTGLLPPGSEMTGQFAGTKAETRDGRRDSLAFATNAVGARTGLATTGGYVRVTYELEENSFGDSLDWVRSETLNPLSADAVVESVLLADVATLEISYFDGSVWQDVWESTGGQGLPEAIALAFTLDDGTREPTLHRLLVPVRIAPVQAGQGGSGGQGR